MARLFDMYMDAPRVDVSGTLQGLRAEQTQRTGRNLDKANRFLRGSASDFALDKATQSIGRAGSVSDLDSSFQSQYNKMLSLDPQKAQELKKAYEARKGSLIGSEVAGAYSGAEADKLKAGAEALMPYDPQTAMQTIQRQDLAKTRQDPVYTPEQKRLVDAKQQNRIAMDRAQASLNSAMGLGDPEQIAYWDQQVKALKANDQKISTQLSELGLSGYTAQTPDETVIEKIKTATQEKIDLDRDIIKRFEFMGMYNPMKESDIPTESQIMADAAKAGYTISRSGASQVKSELREKVQNLVATQTRLRGLAREAKEDKRKMDERVADAGALLRALGKLESGDATANTKSEAITTILRKESGSAIGQEEYQNRVQDLIGPDDYRRMTDELTGLGLTFASWLNSGMGDQRVTAIYRKYLEKVPESELIDFTKALIPDDVLREWRKRDRSQKPLLRPTKPSAPKTVSGKGAADLDKALRLWKK